MDFLNVDNTSGHAMTFFRSWRGNVYEYDPADDGPEVEVIGRIRASHTSYFEDDDPSIADIK